MADVKVNGEKIDYVLVEVIPSKVINHGYLSAVKQSQRGLLRGIKIEKEEAKDKTTKFITLDKRKNVKTHEITSDLIHANIMKHNIMSIEVSDGTTVEITLYRADDSDQKEALGKIMGLVKALVEAGRHLHNDKTTIDISKYRNVPQDWEKCGSVNKYSTDSTTKTTSTRSSGYSGASKAAGHSTTNWSSKKTEAEKKPTFLKRRTKKPTEEVLNEMIENIKKIKAGKYDPPKFKVIKGDLSEKIKKKGRPVKNVFKPVNKTNVGDEEWSEFYTG